MEKDQELHATDNIHLLGEEDTKEIVSVLERLNIV
jgi:hypothetical protein